MSGPNGIGAAFSTFQGVGTSLSVSAARLDGSGFFAEAQAIRGGQSFVVPITNGPTAPGSLNPTSLTFDGAVTNLSTTFTASGVNTGVTTITVGNNSPFTVPASGGSIVATVQQSGILPCDSALAVSKSAGEDLHPAHRREHQLDADCGDTHQ